MKNMEDKKEQRKLSKEIYRASRERVSLALKLFGTQKPDEITEIHTDKDFDTINNLLNSVVSSQKFEEDNDYKGAIQDVGGWTLAAYSKAYLASNAKASPRPLYVIKRGMEVLHMLLHRDLRRRQMTPTESQVYYEFRKLAGALPDPRKQKLSQTDVDAFLEEALHQKIS